MEQCKDKNAPGIPMCGSSCDECNYRAEEWAERLGCDSEEVWEAVNY